MCWDAIPSRPSPGKCWPKEEPKINSKANSRRTCQHGCCSHRVTMTAQLWKLCVCHGDRLSVRADALELGEAGQGTVRRFQSNTTAGVLQRNGRAGGWAAEPCPNQARETRKTHQLWLVLTKMRGLQASGFNPELYAKGMQRAPVVWRGDRQCEVNSRSCRDQEATESRGHVLGKVPHFHPVPKALSVRLHGRTLLPLLIFTEVTRRAGLAAQSLSSPDQLVHEQLKSRALTHHSPQPNVQSTKNAPHSVDAI